MDRRKFLKNTGWSFLGLAASGSLLGSCAAGSKEAKKIMPSASNLKMYWGDLHNHCNITYGHGDMRDAFEAAKGQLDFVSVTPHAMWPDIPGADDPRLKWVIDYHTGAFKRLREGGYEKYVKMIELDFVIGSMRFLGCRGTTGTEASFVDLFEGDGDKVDEMNRRIAAEFGFEKCFSVSGQTYPRKADSRILNVLSSIAQSAYRMANDIRLLQHDRQVEEPFEKNQIGSSAMPYKRNPMRSERICSLSRYLMADAANAPMTASTQWLERTLDDSANRRISLPEGFLCADAVLRLCQSVTNGLHVNEKIVERTLREYLPFLATENIMMEAVKRGGDRQELHEKIRQHSMAATARMKEGEPCDLLDRLAGDPAFGMTREELDQVMEPKLYIGRCEQQVLRFLDECAPLLRDAAAEDGAIDL